MTVVLAVVVGFLAGRIVWLVLRPMFGAALFARENYQGRSLPTATGVVIAVAVVLVEALRLISGSLQDAQPASTPRAGLVFLAVGMAMLGLIDDLAGAAGDRGFGGHLAALRRGHLTTGALKAFGGACVALVAVSLTRPDVGSLQLLADSALVALAANAGNLFDRAPGRAIKVCVLSFVALVVATLAAPAVAAVAVAIGASLALLRDDLSERLMIGDTGANVLGGSIGLGVVAVAAAPARGGVLVALLALNLLAERVSFSSVIDGFAPLRYLDRAGRRDRL